MFSSVTGADTGLTGDEPRRSQLHDRVRRRSVAAIKGEKLLCASEADLCCSWRCGFTLVPGAQRTIRVLTAHAGKVENTIVLVIGMAV